VADTRELVDWRVGWTRVRPWLGRINREVAIVAAWGLVLSGAWLLVRYPAIGDPDNEHATLPRGGEVPGAQWIHDVHRWAAIALALALAIGALAIAAEHLHRRGSGAVRSLTLALVVVALLVAGERSGGGLRWSDYSMHGEDVLRDDGDTFVRDGVPHSGIWSVMWDGRIDRVETLGRGVPVSTDDVSASHYRGHVLAHVLAIPSALVAALLLLQRRATRSRRTPSSPRSGPSRSRGP
jgi:hypothetical protein